MRTSLLSDTDISGSLLVLTLREGGQTILGGVLPFYVVGHPDVGLNWHAFITDNLSPKPWTSEEAVRKAGEGFDVRELHADGEVAKHLTAKGFKKLVAPVQRVIRLLAFVERHADLVHVISEDFRYKMGTAVMVADLEAALLALPSPFEGPVGDRTTVAELLGR